MSPLPRYHLGYNLIELNHYSTAAGAGWYYDDLTFRAANDPWIIEQPVGQTVNAGQPVSFTTVAVGTAYQWQFNGANISGATSSAYSIASVAATNAGSYACVISGTNGTVTSAVALLTVLVPPAITLQPQSQTLLAGTSATFSVAANGTAPLSYQWQWNSTIYPPDTAATSFTATNAGSYSVTVSNQVGVVISDTVTLSFTNPPPGSFNSLSVLADGSLQLNMSGFPGAAYVLEFTADWASWTPLTTNQCGPDGLFQFNDPSVSTNSERFYRLRLQP